MDAIGSTVTLSPIAQKEPGLASEGLPSIDGAEQEGPTASPRRGRYPAQSFQHLQAPTLADERDSLNERVAGLIAKTVGSMWMFYASVIGFAVWMAGLGATVAGDHYPFNLMLLAVGGIMQWLAMIAILVAQNTQGEVSRQAGRAPARPGRIHPQTGHREHCSDRGDPRPLHRERHYLA